MLPLTVLMACRMRFRRDERARAVVQHHVVVRVGHVLQPGERRFLATGARRGHDHRRHEREGVDGALEVLLLAILGAHHHDEPDVPHRVERLGRPREDGLAGDLHQLLAALLAEALARASCQDDGGGLRVLVDHSLQAAHGLRQRVEVQAVKHELGRLQHLGGIHRVYGLRHVRIRSFVQYVSVRPGGGSDADHVPGVCWFYCKPTSCQNQQETRNAMTIGRPDGCQRDPTPRTSASARSRRFCS